MQFPNLFRPLSVGGHMFRNRIISLPNKGKPVLGETGIPSDMFISYLAEKARGGAAQVTVGDTVVDPEYARGRWAPLTLNMGNYGFLNELSFAIKQNGAISSIELNHSGSLANPPGRNPVGPMSYVRPDGVRVDAADENMIKRIIERFAQSAIAARDVGFDGVVIHGAHGWLLGEFLSPLTNHRNDSFGGSLENRARLPIMAVSAVREAVGPNFLIEYRISASELVEGGLQIDSATAFIKMIQDKIDLVNVSGGLDHIPSIQIHVEPTMFLPYGYHVRWAEHMKKALDIPVIALGSITTPELAEQILAEGKSDFIGMSRPLIADPRLPIKAREGRSEDIAPCVRCMNCLADAALKKVISCSVNPRLGRELRLNGEYAERPQPKKVLVIGGGFAGMTAAYTAAERGHSVILAEMTDRLGGILKFTDRDDLKNDLRMFKNHLIAQVKKTGVKLELNKLLTKDSISTYGADAIIIATGSSPKKPPIPGIELPNVCHVTKVHEDKIKLGKRIAIIGGGLAGCETAVELARKGCSVFIIEVLKGFARDANSLISEALYQTAAQLDITFMDETTCLLITEDGLHIQPAAGGNKTFLKADNILYAVGMRAKSELYMEIFDAAAKVVPVGDCVRPRRISEAISEGYFAAMNI